MAMDRRGFLKKSKVDYSQMNAANFQEIDLDSVSSFTLPKKYKILTPVPTASYSVTKDPSGNNIFTITNPKKFWSVTKYLIIQID